jgi:hypothetical protein
MIERRFADDLEASAEVADRINRVNEEEGVRWPASASPSSVYSARSPGSQVLSAGSDAGETSLSVLTRMSLRLLSGFRRRHLAQCTAEASPGAAGRAKGNRSGSARGYHGAAA